MEVVGAVVGVAVESVLTHALNQLGVKSLSDQIQTLRDKKGELIARVNKVNKILQIAEIHGKTRKKDAQDWCHTANTIIHMADVVDKEANVAKICTAGVFCTPNCCSRLKLEKQILKCVEVMDDLLNKASHFSEESLTFLGMEMPTTRLIGSTADKNLKMVWECIVGNEFEKIGVYGMGGVGKTAIMKTISNQLVQQRICFENVLWVTVSKAVDAQTLQKQIAKVLGLDLSDEQDEDSRSSLLLRALQRKGKFVLFLDDIWKPFNLHELGVPEPSKDNGCKIVLTTRSKEVCIGMLCQKHVKVEPLSEYEAWELFLVHVVGQLVPEVEEIAKEIVAECCGLPLAIITIGRSMRSKDVGEWRVALSDLKKSTSLNMDMEEQVIQRLKFSYDQLREKNHQKCFLYCALYPEDYEIDTSELIEYWVMEGLVKGSSKEDEMLRGHVILNILKRCCMLEEVSFEGRGYVDDRDYVKMHDLIRDMALYITKKKPKFMIRTGISSIEIPHEDDWSEDLERVSFMESGIEDISIIPKCPELSTLILSQGWQGRQLKHVARGFFMHMKSLTVLDLSWTLIESLPDSVSDLVNLRGLLLIHCTELVRVPSLSKLQSLRVLKLTYSAIEELPRGMEMLVNLRCLDLRYNRKLKEMFPSRLISKFFLLQELKLHNIKPGNVYARERGKDFVRELSSLTQLENLQIAFHELSDFIAYGEFGNFEGLKKYSIGMERCNIGSYCERTLCLSNSKGIPCNALSLPKCIQYLVVFGFNQITRLSELPLNDSPDLRELMISSCNSIEFIVPEDEDGIFLQRIEKLFISQCQSLSKIYENVSAHGAFLCLKSLQICNCGNIKVFLSCRLLQHLLNLEEISVGSCAKMEELVIADGDECGEGSSSSSTFQNAAIPVLPRLHKLELGFLPKLKSTWSRLFMYSNSWRYLDIWSLDQPDHLFSTRLLQQHFQNLEEITVENCVELEELIVEEEEEESVEGCNNSNHTGTRIDYTVTLPRLKTLSFGYLPKLKSIWKGVMVCDSLQTVGVRNCPELRRLPLFNREHQSAPPSLKKIEGHREWWDSLEWDYPCPEHLLDTYWDGKMHTIWP